MRADRTVALFSIYMETNLDSHESAEEELLELLTCHRSDSRCFFGSKILFYVHTVCYQHFYWWHWTVKLWCISIYFLLIVKTLVRKQMVHFHGPNGLANLMRPCRRTRTMPPTKNLRIWFWKKTIWDWFRIKNSLRDWLLYVNNAMRLASSTLMSLLWMLLRAKSCSMLHV